MVFKTFAAGKATNFGSMRFCLTAVISLTCITAFSQSKTDHLLQTIFSRNSHPVFQEVIQHPAKYRLQIIYTQINRDKNNKPSFKNYYFNYDEQLYFNPASMVKMPLAFLALEKLHEIGKKGVNRHTTTLIDSSRPWHKPLYSDTTSFTSRPSIAHFIKRALLVSENDPYNRLYQFLGQGVINQRLAAKGYKGRITRQFMGLSPEQNTITNPIRFVYKEGATLYKQEEAINAQPFDFSTTIKIGKGYLNRNDSLVNEPFDFTKHNYLPLESMQQMLQSVLFPGATPKSKQFQLSRDDYRFLYQYLSQYSSETPEPKYDTASFYDSYVKFFFRDSTRRMPPHVRVFNKVGWSYGFLTDVSYVADFANRIEFMLAATVYVNADEILNDNRYEYKIVGHPFLYQLGQTIYQYELKRVRKHRPDLSDFKIKYEHREAGDKRPSLIDIDN